jgi:hypothetical protein
MAVNCQLPASTIFSPKTNFQLKFLNFAVRLYYQLSYKHSAQYNMLLINALGIH